MKKIEPIYPTNHHQEFSHRDPGFDFSEPVLTDQSDKNTCDINVIMANYAKTGIFAHVNSAQPKFIDNTEIPNLEEAFRISNLALDMFYELPAQLRKLMDNDPSKLESFISDPDNSDILLKYGLVTKKEVETLPKSDPPSAGSSVSGEQAE